jgi:hypothetical protein
LPCWQGMVERKNGQLERNRETFPM